ncbi:hypothetical protein CVT24_009753 [Panaeolus cyanescens]|uniref:Peptidase M43 pregnancy-associated plasma-A domain-containing protein n=1 Tax=Panaeolus cyanescens TaxID=181874 RepID=A0A409Y9U5_9AGAR|nr:hypothetical protein CVT24_009753 [Panaeolus cyanescens]
MFKPVLVALLCLAQLSVGVVASSSYNGSRCGIVTPDLSERLRIEKDFVNRRTALRKDQRLKAASLPVYFHIISEDESREGGNLPDDMITQQLDVLNQDYAGSGVSFHLDNVTRTVNPEWYRKVYGDNQQNTDMISSLRVGGPEALNIFTVGFVEPPPKQPQLLGYATFPWNYNDRPDIDGVVMLGETMPSGTASPYNLGKTATHEVGHWVGLWHTFQTDDNKPKCEYGNGDFVADTPLQNGASSGCPTGRDSCPDDSGLDPIHNFMDYSDDDCLTEFTPGQVDRFLDQIATYRGVAA